MRAFSQPQSSPPLTLFALLVLLTQSSLADFNSDPSAYPLPCGSPTDIKIRLPPSLNPTVDSSPPDWVSPPQPWLYGDWQITHSTNEDYYNLPNFVFTNTPQLPTCSKKLPKDCPPGTFPGQNVDLSTWTVTKNGTTTIEAAFGYDTPHRSNFPDKGCGWNSVYDFAATGVLTGLNNSWELLAFGYDEIGDGYLVIYETAASTQPAGIDIESRGSSGPSNGTYSAIIKALQGLNNPNITAMLPNMTTLPRNNARSTVEPFICGPSCVNNTDTPT